MSTQKRLSVTVLVASMTASGAVLAAEPGQTTVGGRGFFDLTSIDETSDGVKTDASGIGVDVKRFYIAVDHQFDKTWAANVTTDFNYVSNDSETNLFVKKAYVEGNFNKAFKLRLGSADVPLVPFVEGLYGNRYIENVLVEHLSLEASADYGLHALGEFGGGKAHYAVSAITGNGYKNPSRSETLDLDSRIDFEPVDGLTLALFYRTGKRGQDKESVTTFHTAERSEILAAYVKPKFRLGAEYFQADNWNQVLSPLSDTADGYSVWGTYNVKETVSVFARYDSANPSKDLAPALENTYYNVGVAIKPVAKVDLAFVYKQDKVDNGIYKTSNGTIGGVSSGKHDELGVWVQVSY
jgi:hypothetical protein